MFQTSISTNGIRIALTAGVITTAFASTGVFAADDDQEIEHIGVVSTGSRIVREGAYAPTPVTVITGDQLLSTGVTNIGEALNQLPALSSTSSLANSGAYIGTAGLNTLDLRGMGTDRTLVLVNGKRHVSSSAGSSSVDTNTIPSQWVDRVEIITGGASAIYGADAVTGVVNFILKKNIEGFNVSATKGVAGDSDFTKDQASFSFGQNFDNDRGNFGVSAEYSGQSRLNSLDRDQTAIQYYNMKNTHQLVDHNDPYNPDMILTPNAGYYALSEAGTFYLDGYKNFDADGGYHDTDQGLNQYNGKCANCESLNLKPYTDLQPEFKRYNFNVKTNYDIAENMNLAFEAKYSNSQSTSVGQPAFFFGTGSNALKNTFIKIDNAYLNQSTVDLMHTNKVDSIAVSRFMGDIGARTEDDTRETQRYVLSLTGNEGDWDYEVYGTYGQTDLERVNNNNLVLQNYQNAIDAVKVNGEIVCRSEEARATGCVPLDIIGRDNASQAAIDYVNTVSVGTSVIKQSVVGGTLTNSDLVELPAGYLGLSTGVEYRKESSAVTEPTNAAGTFFNALGNDKGSFDVKEVFAEVSIPLLSDLPLIKQLDADFAARYANYSTIGSATTWKAGLNWEISDELRMRSTYSKAIRAPNIAELYGAESQNYFRASDTCRSSSLAQLDSPGTRQKNCAALGVPTGFDSNYDQKTLEGVSSGNRDLKPERSTSYTAGAVYAPDYIDNFSMSLDYWNIEITDAIASIGAQDIINRCVDSTTGVNNQYCALVTRDPNTHEITSLSQHQLNIASLDAAGIDFDLGYNFEALGGDMKTSLIGTYLIKRRDFSNQNDLAYYDENAGTIGNPKWSYNFNADYAIGNVDVLWRTRFIDHVNLYNNNELKDNANPSNLMTNSTYFISDTGMAYHFESGVTLKVGIDNLFDRDLPYGTTGTGSGSASYDNVGRFFYTTASFKI